MKLRSSFFFFHIFFAIYFLFGLTARADAFSISPASIRPDSSKNEQEAKNGSVVRHLGVSKKVLIVTSNQHFYGNTDIATANHFEEIVMAYDVFVSNGYRVDIVSPEGGAIPIGYVNTSKTIQKKYLYDGNFMDKLEYTLRPAEIVPSDYVAVYYSGGGAAMFGVAENLAIQKVVVQIYENNGVVSAVCHGTAGLVYLKGKDGKSLLHDKNITGFPDAFENKGQAYYATFPFKIDQAVKESGGKFKYSQKGGDNFYIRDGRLITGQDPSSTSSVAKEVVGYLHTHGQSVFEQDEKTELTQIGLVLNDYIEGTANGEPDRVRHAFHDDLNLYSVKNENLDVWRGKTYVDNIQTGKKNTRQGRIVSIDFEKDVAMAKIEILIPGFRLFTDYLMLAKLKGSWKIIHKSFTSRPV